MGMGGQVCVVKTPTSIFEIWEDNFKSYDKHKK